jgi:predicted TIM-barrel fold metal-dependent hydrolase
MEIPELTATDKFIYANEIKPYLPRRIFDAHAHLQIPQFNSDLEEALPITKASLFKTIDLPVLKKWWQILFSGAKVNGLLLPTPTKGCDINGMNEYIAKNVDAGKNRFSLIVSPELPAEQLEQQIINLKPQGLKPYMCFSRLDDPNLADICDMIPEPQIAIANKYKLAITLHVAKPRGMADLGNLAEINRLVRKYSDCNFILAHCGRCFIAPNMEAALKDLPVAENLWIDTSAVCDTGVFLHLFKNFNTKKILFGTDLVTAAGFRGTYIRMGMSWDWYLEDAVKRPSGQDIKATFAAYENLCTLFQAARFCDLTKNDLDDVFFNNSAKLFNLL